MNTRNALYLAVFTGFFYCIGFSGQAHCELKSSPALQKIAEANNETYLELKKLGPNATPEQQKAIRDRNFAPGLQMLQQERLEQEAAWDKVREAQHGEMQKVYGDGLKRDAGDEAEAAKKGSSAVKDDDDEGDQGLDSAANLGHTKGSAAPSTAGKPAKNTSDNNGLSGTFSKGSSRTGQGGRSGTGIDYNPQGAKRLEFSGAAASAEGKAKTPAKPSTKSPSRPKTNSDGIITE